MAKKSVIARNEKRRRVIEKYEERRSELKTKSRSLDPDVRMAALDELQRLPRNASPVRFRNRCALTGRPRGYYGRFGLSRIKLREFAMQSDIPGVRKSSW